MQIFIPWSGLVIVNPMEVNNSNNILYNSLKNPTTNGCWCGLHAKKMPND